MMAVRIWLPALSAVVLGGCRESSAANRGPDANPPARSLSAAASGAPSSSPGATPACPSEMVHIEAFCIDRYEAHLVIAGDPTREHSPYERPKSGERYEAKSSAGVVPQGYVSRIDAAAACETAGKRLCHAREWYRACSSGKHFRYPYGNDLVADRCNTGKGHALHAVFGNVPLSYDSHYNNPRVNQEPGFLAKTGAYTECATEEGVFDMVGNLHEWVADDVTNQVRAELPFEKGDQWLGKPGMGMFMGGYFSSHSEHGRGCLYVTATHAPDYHDYSTGFRCCADSKE